MWTAPIKKTNNACRTIAAILDAVQEAVVILQEKKIRTGAPREDRVSS